MVDLNDPFTRAEFVRLINDHRSDYLELLKEYLIDDQDFLYGETRKKVTYYNALIKKMQKGPVHMTAT